MSRDVNPAERVMKMDCKAELDYLVKVLKRMNMQVLVIHRGEKPESGVDLGLRKTLGVRTGLDRKSVV